MEKTEKNKLYIIQFRTDVSCEHEQKCYNDELKDVGLELVYLNAVQDELPNPIPKNVR